MPERADPLATPLQYLKGVGPRRAADLEHAGLRTVEDLLYRFPLRYEDRTKLAPIASLKPGMKASITGRVLSCGMRSTRRAGFVIFEAVVGDASGAIRVVWFNQKYLRDVFKAGQRVILFGSVELRGTSGLQMTSPEYEHLDDEADDVQSGRIVPVYERAGTVTSKLQRSIVHEALQRLPADLSDPLPESVRLARGLPPRHAALLDTHFPAEGTPVERLNRFSTPAQQRLLFEEAYLFQLGIIARRRFAASEVKPVTIAVDDRIRRSALAVLPFRLTDGQKQAVKDIVDDMKRPHPMNRLLQGDVGAGKTIVALLAGLVAMENGAQVAFMAPTEILAEQHFMTIATLLQASRFRVALLTGSVTASARKELLAGVESGAVHLLVGTHALVQGGVRFARLGLAIIDEQHRFGVLQRATLREKALHPDVLVMTATPIPRTLALTLYGDLDVSIIRDLPPGRQPVRTFAKPESRRDDIYRVVREALEAGRQAYVVYPLVEESDKVALKAATAMADELAHAIFPEFQVGLLHGRMKGAAKERVMKAFAAGDLQVLVSTTVIEVGVDVPNATVMIVEHAERFGLSQLHQLRGRVGRGVHQSFCFLIYQSPLSDEGRERLKALTESSDGFVIAERDLELRGAGDFFGTRQAGLPTFRMIDLARDRSVLEDAQRDAGRWFDREKPSPAVIQGMLSDWATRFKLVEVG